MIPLARSALLIVAASLSLLDAQADPPCEVPAYCVPTVSGGPAPPGILGTEQLASVKTILAQYRADALTADDARAIRQALHDAGLRPGPALDNALASAGFSTKRLDALAPCPAPDTNPKPPISADRVVPPPQ